MTELKQSLPLHKAFLRGAVDFVLQLGGTKLPPYFHLRDRISYLVHGLEPSIIRVASKVLAPGDTVVDVGANVGFITREFARIVGTGGRIFSFEPDPGTFQYLAYNTRGLPQVVLTPAALSDSNGFSDLYLHPVSGMSNSLVNAWEKSRPVTVKTLTFDAWRADANPGRISLVKIDVEGAEVHVLRGMRETLAMQDPPRLVLEFCPGNLGSPGAENEIFRILSEHGYRTYRIDSHGTLHSVECPTDVRGTLNANGYANLFAETHAT